MTNQIPYVQIQKRIGPFLIWATTFFLFFFVAFATSQIKTFDDFLQKKRAKRSISPQEIHEYTICLESNQYLHLKVKSSKIELVETITRSDGQRIPYARFNFPDGFSIKIFTEQSDSLRVQFAAPGQEKKANYFITLEELREATTRDKSEVTAKIKYDEAFLLEEKGDDKSLQVALQKYSESLKVWQTNKDHKMIIKTLQRLGETCFKASDFQGMQIYYNRARRQSRLNGDQNSAATALYKIGVAKMNKNEYFEALDSFEEALEQSQQLNLCSLEADILTSIGQIYTEFNDYEGGIEYAEKSLEIRRSLDEEEKIASALLVLGDAYLNYGESQKALDYYHEALRLHRKSGDQQGEAILLGSIGWVYDQFSQYDTALDYYQQSLAISEDIGYRFGKAWIVKLSGDIHRKVGDYEMAIEKYNISLDLCRQMGVRVGEASNYSNLAMVYVEMDSTERALNLLNQALVIMLQINDREGEARSLNKIGRVYARSGDYIKAIDYHKQALAVAQTIHDPRLFQRTYFDLGKQERRAGNIELAKEYIEKSLQIADSLRSSVLSQKMRASYFASIHSCYDELILLYMQQHRQYPNAGYDHLALQVSEKSRCQSLLEMLNEGQVDLRAGVDPALLEREHLVRQQLNARERQRQRMANEKSDSDVLASLEKEIRTLLNEHESLETRIRQEQPRFAAIEKAEALPCEKIQTDVLDDSTMLIEYALNEEQSFAWMITSDSIKSFELPAARLIEETARLVYQNLIARNVSFNNESADQRRTRIHNSDEQLYVTMSDLSAMILSPMAGHFNKPRLVFICDEILQYIPMSALPKPGGAKKQNVAYDPLVNDYWILTAPSASALSLIREEKAGSDSAEHFLTIFADPVFSADDPRFKTSLPAMDEHSAQMGNDDLDVALRESGVGTRSDLSRLPFSRMEASDIMNLTENRDCQCFMDFDANCSRAISPELSYFKIIHFATHGMMNSAHPELSGLVLSLYDEQGQPQNGYLRLQDIYHMHLNADLVVLSACQTALGKNVRGEGLIGLTRGFMYAGAPRVVASLWKVDDEATAELMKLFYGNMLKKKMAPAEALQKAQIKIQKQKRWQSPYYWAAFVMQGDWQD